LEPANFFETLPPGANVSTLCNLLTDWDDEHGATILRNCRAAMRDGGRIVIIDRVLPPAGDPNHRPVAFLDLFFLVMEGGRIRTQEEFEHLLQMAGFQASAAKPVGGGFSVIEGFP
jgi:hypothetical protein